MSAQSSSLESKVGRFANSFERTAKHRAALPPAMLATMNLDSHLAATTVLGALPRIKKLRASIVRAIPAFDVGELDNLEAYAEALCHAQVSYLAADAEPAQTGSSALPRGVEVRAQHLTDVSALARRGLIDAAFLSELRGGSGYRNVAWDIGVLVRVLRESWRDIKGKSAVEARELVEAENLCEEIVAAHEQRAERPARTRAADDRARAYTLLVNAYDEVRRAVTYLRWHEGDVDKFAPSLYAGRGGRAGTGRQATRRSA